MGNRTAVAFAIVSVLPLGILSLPARCLLPAALAALNDRPATERGIVALDQAERDLGNPFVVACLAPRPGDEDSAVLVYCRKKLGAYTVTAFATRGELGEGSGDAEAGAIDRQQTGVARTCQALEVAAAQGSDAYFLNLPDQPTEQSSEQTIGAWEKKDGLLAIVRFIRAMHPDVIICGGESRPGDPMESALEQLAVRAMDSAADASQFPAAGPPWSVKRIYNGGSQEDHKVAVNVGEFDAIRGQTYVRIAATARRAYGPA